MAQRANFVEEGMDRVQSAFQSVEDEVQKLQKQIEDRTNDFNKKAEKRLKRFRKDLKKNDVYRRAESRWEDVSKQLEERQKQIEERVEQGLESLLGAFQIASRGEVAKLDRKLNRINRRLKALDKAISEQGAAPARAVGE